MIFLRINLPKFLQLKEYLGKSGVDHAFLSKAKFFTTEKLTECVNLNI